MRTHWLGVPQSSRHAFELLGEAGLIDQETVQAMHRMVGFRSVAVHSYRSLDIDILRRIVEQRLTDFTRFTGALLQAE